MSLKDQNYPQHIQRSTYLFENKDKKEFQIKNRINTTVNSTHQSSRHVQDTVSVKEKGLTSLNEREDRDDKKEKPVTHL